MSLKDKLYNTEATPPANAWDKIAAALDESHDVYKFSSALYALEVTPPPNAWNQIATSLDDNASDGSYYTRLYDLEIAPPFNTWNKIVSELEPETVEKSTRRVIPIFLRYAAAAIFIGFAAFTIVKLTTGKNKSNLTDQAKDTVTTEQSTSNSIAGSAKNSTDNAAPIQEETKTNNDKIAVAEKPVKRYKLVGNSSEGKAHSVAQRVNVYSPSKQVYAYQDHLPKIADRYFMLLTPTGSFIRMSKKWGSLLCCVSGEEQDPDCKDQLQKWQEKIADSPITQGPGNFLDILSLVSSLNEGAEL